MVDKSRRYNGVSAEKSGQKVCNVREVGKQCFFSNPKPFKVSAVGPNNRMPSFVQRMYDRRSRLRVNRRLFWFVRVMHNFEMHLILCDKKMLNFSGSHIDHYHGLSQ